jgi:hypothetical protein
MSSALGVTRTPGQRFRKPLLYPPELRGQPRKIITAPPKRQRLRAAITAVNPPASSLLVAHWPLIRVPTNIPRPVQTNWEFCDRSSMIAIPRSSIVPDRMPSLYTVGEDSSSSRENFPVSCDRSTLSCSISRIASYRTAYESHAAERDSPGASNSYFPEVMGRATTLPGSIGSVPHATSAARASGLRTRRK